MAAKVCGKGVWLSGLAILASWSAAGGQTGRSLPESHVTALSGQALVLPRDLPARANILIVGFGRNSQDATTAWEKPVRTQLAQGTAVNFYDMAMLAEVPGLLRPLVLHAVKNKVPDVLKSRFLPLTQDEDAWKQLAGYRDDAADAAYVLLVDRHGVLHWSTHASFTPGGFHELAERAQQLAANTP